MKLHIALYLTATAWLMLAIATSAIATEMIAAYISMAAAYLTKGSKFDLFALLK